MLKAASFALTLLIAAAPAAVGQRVQQTPRPTPTVTPRPAPTVSPAPRPAPVSPGPISAPRPTPAPVMTPRPTPVVTPRPTPAPVYTPPVRTPPVRTPTPQPAPTPRVRVEPTPSYPSPSIPTPRVTPTPTPRLTPAPAPVQPSPWRRSEPSPVRTTPAPVVEPPRGGGTEGGSRLRDLYERRTRTPRVDEGNPRPTPTTPAPVRGGDRVDPVRPVPPTRGTTTPVESRPGSPSLRAPVKGNESVGGGRYPVPGREPVLGKPTPTKPVTSKPVDETPRLRPRDGVRGNPSPGGTRGDAVRAPVARIAPRERAVPPPSSPHLNPPRDRGRSNWMPPRHYDPRYDATTWVGCNRWLYGTWQWSGHCSVLGPGVVSRGCYWYPFYFSSWWCRSWYSCHSSLNLWWSNCAPSCSPVSSLWWWWPSTCYLPGTWLGSVSYVDFGAGYPAYAGYPGSTTVIYSSAPASSEAPAAVGDEPAESKEEAKAAESLRTLADRHLRLGDWYFKQARYEEAAESYVRALAYVPDDGAAHFIVADALFASGDYHYAAYMIRKALDLDPGLANAEADKRAFYGDPKQFDDQLAKLGKYCDEKRYDAAAHLVLGYNLRFSGQKLEAARAFRRVLEIEPGDTAARAFLSALAGGPAPEEKPAEEPKPDTSRSGENGR